MGREELRGMAGLVEVSGDVKHPAEHDGALPRRDGARARLMHRLAQGLHGIELEFEESRRPRLPVRGGLVVGMGHGQTHRLRGEDRDVRIVPERPVVGVIRLGAGAAGGAHRVRPDGGAAEDPALLFLCRGGGPQLGEHGLGKVPGKIRVSAQDPFHRAALLRGQMGPGDQGSDLVPAVRPGVGLRG